MFQEVVLNMNFGYGPESWRGRGFPPLPVLQGAMELLEEQAAERDRERRSTLTRVVEAVESLASHDMKSFIHPSAQPVPLNVVRAVALSYQMVVGLLEQHVLEEELSQHTPDLLVRYAQAIGPGLSRAKQVHAVLVAAIENVMGERRAEPLEERLVRAVASVQNVEPIDLGDFSQYGDDDLEA